MDETVGTIRKTLKETGLDKNTIVMFISDHGCHFKTRNIEYKRSPHESSIHVPLIFEGPGFNRGITVPEIVSHVDLAPSLLSAVGLPTPASMQGHNFMPLVERKKPKDWRNEAYFEMSEFVTGRAATHPAIYLCGGRSEAAWMEGGERRGQVFRIRMMYDPSRRIRISTRIFSAGRATHKDQAGETACLAFSRITNFSRSRRHEGDMSRLAEFPYVLSQASRLSFRTHAGCGRKLFR